MKLLVTAGGPLLVLTACGSAGRVVGPAPSSAPTPTATAPAPTPANSGYLAESVNMGSDGSWAIFWDGSASTLYQAQRNGRQVDTANGEAEGQINSFRVSATAYHSTVGPWTYDTAGPNLLRSGGFARTAKGDGFELAVPWSDGTVHAYDFRPGNLSDYNADVAKMQQQIQADQQAAQQAQQQQQQAQQQQAQEQAQQLQQKKAASCASIGAHFTAGNLCGSNVPGNPSGKAGADCSAAYVGLNFDGSINRSSLLATRQTFPGCFS